MDIERINKEKITKIIENVIGKQLLLSENKINDNIFNKNLSVDSIAVITIISLIEEKFSIDIDDDDLSVELFSNIDSIYKYLKRKNKLLPVK
jgi:acyl carrier protein